MAQEKQFENKIKKHLKEQGCYFVKYFANRMTKSGIPDILASVGGYFVGIEVKSSIGKPKELQIYHVNKINDAGGFAVVVSPEQWEELKELIQRLKQSQRLEARKIVNRINSKFF
jgi:hypothetical protein